MSEWLALALQPDVSRRALRVAIVVGTLLVAINHGDAMLRLEVDGARALKMLLTYLVPYGVSTHAAVAALRGAAARAPVNS